MITAGLLGGILKRTELIERALKGELKWIEVAEALRLTPRQVRRLKSRYQARGAEGLLDYRHQSRPRNKKNQAVVDQVLALYRGQYRDWNVRHFHEKLGELHAVTVSYPWVLYTLRRAGLIATKLKPGPPRRRRERRAMPGMMLQIDGSEHAWLGPEHGNFDLVAIIDDATSEIYSAVFTDEEDLRSVFFVLRETIQKHGIFCSLYADRASHFFYTPNAGGKVKLAHKTHCQMALDRLGTQMIPAYSPEAKGRIERMWGTIQGRLPQELKLAGITTRDAANQYLREKFVPDYNRRFAVKAREAGTAFVSLHPSVNLDHVFALHTHRIVKGDNTVSYKTKTLQIPVHEHRMNFTRCEVTVIEHMDGRLTLMHGPRELGRYDKDGNLLMYRDQKPMKKKTGT